MQVRILSEVLRSINQSINQSIQMRNFRLATLAFILILLPSCHVGEESVKGYPPYRFTVRVYAHSNLMVGGPYTADSVYSTSNSSLKIYRNGDSSVVYINEGTRMAITDEWGK